MRFLKLAKKNIEPAKKLTFYLHLRNRSKRQFMQTILTHILSIIRSKKNPRSIWVTSGGIQKRSGRSRHYSKRVQLIFIQICLDHFLFMLSVGC